MWLGYIDPGTGWTITSAGGLLVIFLSGILSFLLLFFKRIFHFFGRHKKPLGSLIVLILILGAAAGGFYKMTSHKKFTKKIVILGFDALSPEIIEPLMQQGRLPNFQLLKSRGSYRHLTTTNPPQSPVAWSAFATGQNPGKNAVGDFITRDPATYKISLGLSQGEGLSLKPAVKTKRFWQYASQRGVPVTILACPVTFPPDKVKGRLLSGMGVPDLLGTEGTFSFYTSQEKTGEESTGGKVFYVKKAPSMILSLTGPRVSAGKGKAEPVTVPFKVDIVDGKSVDITFRQKTFRLKTGEFSPWQEVSFDLSVWRKARGIFKFLLLSVEPEFQLYVSPINFDPRAPFLPISSPHGYSRELSQRIGLYHTQGMPFDTWALNEDRIDEKIFVEMTEEVLAEKKKMLKTEWQRFSNGVFFIYFESPDIIQHMFWRFRDEEHPLADTSAPGAYRDMIAGWYEKMDKILGQVMADLKPEDTLIVLSDHGFGTFRRAVHINSWLRDEGYLELKDPSAMAGEPLLKDIDWSKTRAYAIGFNGIFINEKGREKEGVVSPGKEKEDLKEELTRKLEAWVDAKEGTAVIKKIYKREEAFWGKYAQCMPDLVVGYNKGFRASWQTALGAVPKNIIEDNLKKWSGDHLFDPSLVPGVLFANRAIGRENPSIMDITPTVLKLIGFTPEEIKSCDFDGEALF